MKRQGSVWFGAAFFALAVLLFLIFQPLSIETASRGGNEFVSNALAGLLFVLIILLAALAALEIHGSSVSMPAPFNEDEGDVCDQCDAGPVYAEDRFCRFCGKPLGDTDEPEEPSTVKFEQV